METFPQNQMSNPQLRVPSNTASITSSQPPIAMPEDHNGQNGNYTEPKNPASQPLPRARLGLVGTPAAPGSSTSIGADPLPPLHLFPAPFQVSIPLSAGFNNLWLIGPDAQPTSVCQSRGIVIKCQGIIKCQSVMGGSGPFLHN